MNQIEQVTTWIDAAQQEKSVRNIANYLAYTMSELAECLACVRSESLLALADRMEHASKLMRDGQYDLYIGQADRVELMDGAMDTLWTASGLGHMLGDAQGAFAEVARSNHSKFENGVCALDSTGKVIKGPGYFKPELAKFLREPEPVQVLIEQRIDDAGESC